MSETYTQERCALVIFKKLLTLSDFN